MSMATRRLVIFDLDGTLLTSEHTLLDSTRRAIGALRDGGHQVALASSRPPRSVVAIARELSSEVTLAVSLNGAFVVRSGEVIFEQGVNPEVYRALVERARKQELHLSVYSAWQWLVEVEDRWAQGEADIVGFVPSVVEDLRVVPESGVHKVLIMGDPKRVGEFRRQLQQSDLATGLDITLSKPSYCEIVARGVSKAEAAAQAALAAQLSMTHVVAFGDGENDLSLITAAGTGVAMGNAMPEVCQAADLVTNSNDEDGIAKALVELGLVPDTVLND